jgi:uncharacterized protein (TIGR04255 family)
VSAESSPLPSFDAPPVNEVVLDLQFAPLERLGTPQLGLLWQDFRDRFPKISEYAPIDRRVLNLVRTTKPAPQFRLETFDLPPLRRLWFHSGDDTQIIQVQLDRFIYNWRRIKDEPYPRYGDIRAGFHREYSVFRRFVERENLGAIAPDSCEVTYINRIAANDGWRRHGQLSRVVTLWAPPKTGAFLAEPEAVQFAAGYSIPDPTGQPQGRLNISLQPAVRISDGSEILALNLAATLLLDTSDPNGVLAVMDVGREWIVRAFADVTTDEMQQIWGRRHDG